MMTGFKKLIRSAAALMVLAGGAMTAAAGPIEDLQPGNWLEIPNTHLRPVLPSPLPAGNPYYVMAAWSGGAFDTKRNRLMVWGGGHNDYCGNEVYAFDVPTLRWLRLTNPGGDPTAVHSYDQLEYLPEQDVFFAAGGSLCSPGGNAQGESWAFNPATNTWTQRADLPGPFAQFWELAMDSDYDPVSKKFIMVGYKETADYNPATNTWTRHGNSFFRDLGHTGAVDPINRKYVTLGDGTAQVFDISANGTLGARRTLTTTGAREIENETAPGLVWDPVVKKLVAWGSGGNVYTLDMATLVWTRIAPKNSVNPGNPRSMGDYHGTFGRWRYMPAYNAYIVATTIDTNVFVYKLSDGSGTTAPAITLTASPTSVSAGANATLTWSVTNGTSCTASGGWSGTKALTGTESVGPINATTVYTLTCTDAQGGSASQAATVTVAAAPAPTVTFSASPTSVANGGSSTLTWTSSNATSCTGSGGLTGWAGTKATSGSAAVGPFSGASTFTLACTGSGGTTTRTATVSLLAAPTVTFSASPTSVTSGGSSTLTWSSSNATTCTASGAWAGSKATSGSQSTGALSASSTYTLACDGPGGTTTRNASVTVTAPTPAPTVTISANPNSVLAGSASTLSWSSTNATSCTASGAWSGAKATSGSQSTGALSTASAFTLSCTGTGGTGSASVTVGIAAVTPAPTVNLSASPASVANGGSTTLSWSTANATSCTASGGWSGTKGLSGSEAAINLTADASYTLSCAGPGGNGSATANVTVAAPLAAPVISFSSSATSIASNGTATLTWSATGATSCTASGAWTGTLGTSGSMQVGPLTQDVTYTIACTGAGGTSTQSVNIDVTAAASGDSEGGIGAFDPRSLLALFGLLAVRGRRRLVGACVVAMLGLFVVLPQVASAATADEDWQARKSAPGVVRAVGFDTIQEYQNCLKDLGRDNAWDSTVKSSGAGSLRFDIKSQTHEGAAGSCYLNFSEDLSVQFGANEEFWIQWRQKFDAFVIDHTYQHFSGSGEWKQVIIAQGDTPTVVANACTEAEMVMQNQGDRDYPTMYIECGKYDNFEDYLGGSKITRQNQRLNSSGANNCLWWPIPGDTSGCLKYVPNEWMTFMVHVKMGPEGVAESSVSDEGPKRGFINSTVEFYVGRQGQPLQLAHRQTGLVIPRGQYYDASRGTNPDNPSDPGYSSGWKPADGHPNAKYGKIWLLPYNTQKDWNEVHQDASIWYDEVIISRQRIADPGVPPSTTQPTVSLSASPSSVQSGSASTLTWSSTNATSCTASGGWSGTKATSGTASTGALTANATFSLSCSNAAGESASASASVTVAAAAAPTVSLSASPTSVASGGSSTLTWSSSNATSCTATGGTGGWAGTKTTSGSQAVSPINATSTFTLACTGAGGTTSRSATVTLLALPTVTLTANPTTVTSGGRSTLTWSSTNATSCVASGAWAGNKATSGTEQSAALSQNSQFILDCTGSGGTVSASATVQVSGAPAMPTVTISANPAAVASGGTSVLTWSSTNATSCTASGAWTGTRGTSGTFTTAALTQTSEFTLACTGAGGTVSSAATVNVAAAPVATLNFAANSSSVPSGSPVTLTWSSGAVSACTASGGWTGSVGTSGSTTTAPLSNATDFTLTCSGAGGSISRTVSVAVQAASSSEDSGGVGAFDRSMLFALFGLLALRRRGVARAA